VDNKQPAREQVNNIQFKSANTCGLQPMSDSESESGRRAWAHLLGSAVAEGHRDILLLEVSHRAVADAGGYDVAVERPVTLGPDANVCVLRNNHQKRNSKKREGRKDAKEERKLSSHSNESGAIRNLLRVTRNPFCSLSASGGPV